MSLLDSIKQNIQQTTAPTVGPNLATPAAIPQTQALSRLSSQVRTGKAGGLDTEAGLSSQAEAQAARQGELAREQLATQAKTQTEQLTQQQAAQEQQFSQAEIEQHERRLNQSQDFNQKLSTMLSDFEQQAAGLDLQQQGAKLEQMGFLLRLSDDKYVNNLQNEARRARLDNELSFKENLQRAVFKDEQDLMSSNLNFRRLMNADDRTFREELANIDIETAMTLSTTKAAASNTQAMYKGLGDTATAGGQAYTNYKAAPAKAAPVAAPTEEEV